MHQTLTLSDGTKLHVNSGTRVIYPSDFTEDKREIFVSGELFADVAKDPDKAFIILPVTSMCRYWVQSSISVPTRILRR